MINTKNIKKIINKTPRAKANGVLSTSTDSCFIHRLKSVVFAEEFNKPNFKKCFSKKKFIFSVGFIILIVIIFSGLGFYFSNRIYPGVEVLGINLGGKKTDEASHLLSQKINTPEKLELFSEEKVFPFFRIHNVFFSRCPEFFQIFWKVV